MFYIIYFYLGVFKKLQFPLKSPEVYHNFKLALNWAKNGNTYLAQVWPLWVKNHNYVCLSDRATMEMNINQARLDSSLHFNQPSVQQQLPVQTHKESIFLRFFGNREIAR